LADRIAVVVIGGGQARLATGRELTRAGVEHAVLERGRIGESWRGSWDSFCLVTPSWTVAFRRSVRRDANVSLLYAVGENAALGRRADRRRLAVTARGQVLQSRDRAGSGLAIERRASSTVAVRECKT
jgi:cation diffusion facilitator CzcD-associated flavoprotein CzcO